MIELDNILFSEEILEKKFVCDLSACKGACCVEGDAGAPLEEEELKVLDKAYESVKPFMRKEGIAVIENQGTCIKDPRDGEYVTPLVNNKECAYVTFDSDGTAKCSIELAHKAGKTDFLKPISCHLYPIRVKRYDSFTALNYHNWSICNAACSLGEKLNVKVYRFLKEPLVRAFGKEWFNELSAVDDALESQRENQD